MSAGCLTVTVLRGEGLVGAQPYITVSVGNLSGSTSNGRPENPTFNQAFSFPCAGHEGAVVFTLWSGPLVGRTRQLASAALPLSDVAASPAFAGPGAEARLHLSGHGAAAGTLFVRLAFAPAPKGAPPPPQQPQQPHMSPQQQYYAQMGYAPLGGHAQPFVHQQQQVVYLSPGQQAPPMTNGGLVMGVPVARPGQAGGGGATLVASVSPLAKQV